MWTTLNGSSENYETVYYLNQIQYEALHEYKL
jgi:hypothetical protein